MGKKTSFAHAAARLSIGFAIVGAFLICLPSAARMLQISMPLLNAALLFSLMSVGLVVCLVISVVCGFIALSAVRQHGREGIIIPAAIGLALSALMLAPILYGVGLAASNRAFKVFAREKSSSSPEINIKDGAPARDTSPAKRAGATAKLNNFIPAPNRKDLVHDAVRNVLYITAGTEVLRYSFSSNQFLPPFELGGNLYGIDLSPDGQTLAVADRSRAAEYVWIHVVDLATGTNSRAFFNAARMEGGTYSVVFGGDNAVYTTSAFEGSGRVPFRRYDLSTGRATEIQTINQNTMLCASADRGMIAFAEGNSSAGRFGTYDLVKKAFVLDSRTERFNWEVAISRDGALVAVPNYRTTTIVGESPRTIGGSDGGPVAAAFHPARDVVFFPWARSAEIRAYDTRTWKLLERIDFSDTFEHTGNHAFVNGRLRTSQDGAWLFCTVKGGVCYVRPKLNNELATVDRR
jgi:hypothetical protein